MSRFIMANNGWYLNLDHIMGFKLQKDDPSSWLGWTNITAQTVDGQFHEIHQCESLAMASRLAVRIIGENTLISPDILMEQLQKEQK